ncbi:MAG: hypothetical protein IT250_12740, partial [Chitinophagaceae bacterium]|nr:hypothetical protein [Chitinophagaceae bacterium]
MRFLVLSCILFVGLAARTQTVMPYSAMVNTQRKGIENNHAYTSTHLSGKKWFISRYSGVSTGFSFFNGSAAHFVSVPLGLQLNRRINNNFFAVAGIAAAPTYWNFSHSLRPVAGHSLYSNSRLISSGTYGVNARAELGLMYISDDKTFSFSGSIGIQRGSYPAYFFQS